MPAATCSRIDKRETSSSCWTPYHLIRDYRAAGKPRFRKRHGVLGVRLIEYTLLQIPDFMDTLDATSQRSLMLACKQLLESVRRHITAVEAGTLAGVHHLTSLRQLQLRDCEEFDRDAVVLQKLQSLECISLTASQPLAQKSVIDLRRLRGLSRLQCLDLDDGGYYRMSYCGYSALTGLQALRRLVIVPATGLRDASCLSNLLCLETLELDQCEVQDITPLSALQRLQDLHLTGNFEALAAPVSTGPLAGLTALHALALDWLGVTDLGPLAGLTRLRTLSLCHGNFTDVRPLAKLTNLVSLSMFFNRDLQDATVLGGLTALQFLDMSACGSVWDFGFLTRLTRLHALGLALTCFGERQEEVVGKLPCLEAVSLPCFNGIEPELMPSRPVLEARGFTCRLMVLGLANEGEYADLVWDCRLGGLGDCWQLFG